jgi:hypothetical protein
MKGWWKICFASLGVVVDAISLISSKKKKKVWVLWNNRNNCVWNGKKET